MSEAQIKVGDVVTYHNEFFDVAGHRRIDEFVAGVVESFDGRTVNVLRPEGGIAQYWISNLRSNA